MIGLLPRYRPRALKRPTLAYTRLRRRAKPRAKVQAPRTAQVNTEIVLFDHGPAELPVAMVRPRHARARAIALFGGLQQWLLARWQWLRPRTVPVAVAALGMMAVLKSAEYLAQDRGDASPHVRVVHIDLAQR